MRITVERSSRSLCDVTQVTEQGALVPFRYFRVQCKWRVIANSIQKIGDMLGITSRAGLVVIGCFVFQIVKYI